MPKPPKGGTLVLVGAYLRSYFGLAGGNRKHGPLEARPDAFALPPSGRVSVAHDQAAE